MIKGMTGFGSGTINAGKVKGVVEIKTVNHRYLDLAFYLPNSFGSIETKIRSEIAHSFQRGRVTIAIKILDRPGAELVFNPDVVEQYLKYAKGLKKELGLAGELRAIDLIRLPGVVDSRDPRLDPEGLWPAIRQGLRRAMGAVVAMRKSEGRTLARDTKSVITRMRAQVKKIETRTKAILREKKVSLTTDEFVALQKSNDVNEELTRLKHYMTEFASLLQSTDSVGKKLDFVAQEMQRETNTIGSKVQDGVVSNAVIALKSKVEKLREQAQNIE